MELKPFKVVFVGSSSVGKTSLISSMIHGSYNDINDATIGVSFHQHKSENVKLYIWDTAGQERFRSLVPMYVRDSHIVIAVFDSTNRVSYNELIYNWIPYIRKVDEEVNIIIVESKVEDKEAGRFTEIAQEYAKENFLQFWRVSAKDGTNVKELLDDIISKLKIKISQKKINLIKVQDNESGYCCK